MPLQADDTREDHIAKMGLLSMEIPIYSRRIRRAWYCRQRPLRGPRPSARARFVNGAMTRFCA